MDPTTRSDRSCPDCLIPLRLEVHEALSFDKCPQCGGIWLDKGEMTQIVEMTLHSVMPTPFTRRRGRSLSDLD
ncbi:zf-TFIIB domain-containing protein [Asticcacaulis sp. SL142]|uniref:TFIIB-type zinc ribbon-containing protein n=1 Tax=Asticcacaulis sp. SL142 TaxID=2995155 RepID=UPI00226CAA37|nr:zf-TFIIB domain-containing protein [Asticcacaulis sp. SL142]WAC49409.1 zf-TFIIB domain-containing protein [Asticcacaulis sp. SL142]